jgi:Ca2+-binding EF-hand superfamily protein
LTEGFTSQIWDRHRHVPPSIYRNPLTNLFDEFDVDGDGHLTVTEIESALVSRGVQIHADQLSAFIKAADLNQNEQIERDEFEPFLYALADADQKSTR